MGAEFAPALSQLGGERPGALASGYRQLTLVLVADLSGGGGMDELTAHDAAALRDLYYRAGPYASVYVDVRAIGVPEAVPRWRAVGAQLAQQGAGPELVDVVRDHVLAAAPGPGMLAVFAARHQVLLAVAMPGWTGGDMARFDVLPDLLPLLEWLQSRPAYLTAVVDRTGADITLYPGGAGRPTRWSVFGSDDEIERNAPGGWAQARYQRRAEDSWEHNAVRVVDELVPALRRHAVRLLVLAGDPRALQYLEKHLPAGVAKRVVVRHVSGGRHPDGSEAVRAEQVEVDLRLAVAERTAELLTQFDEERGPGGRAVEGVSPTLQALAEGRVRVLLLAPDAGRAGRTAWFGPDGAQVAADRETLERVGASTQQARLADIAVRATLLTGAHIRILPVTGLPGTPREGIGALCRFR
jgi:hypothetical protein